MIPVNKHFFLRNKKLLLPIAIFPIIILLFLWRAPEAEHTPLTSPIEISPTNTIQEQQNIIEPEPTTLFVEIKGAVHKPGVYELEEGERVLALVQLAGGYLSTANSSSINHAERLMDEMVLYIPFIGEEVSEEITDEKNSLLNINKADSIELTSLPGIGPSKAQAIIQYREENGPFKEAKGLMDVPGIGTKTFEQLEELITVK